MNFNFEKLNHTITVIFSTLVTLGAGYFLINHPMVYHLFKHDLAEEYNNLEAIKAHKLLYRYCYSLEANQDDCTDARAKFTLAPDPMDKNPDEMTTVEATKANYEKDKRVNELKNQTSNAVREALPKRKKYLNGVVSVS